MVVPVSPAATPKDYGCQTVGGGEICRWPDVEVKSPEKQDIVCGSGAGAFNVFDQFVDNESRTRWYDENGDLANYTGHDVYRVGQWSNPLTGDVVPYTQHYVENADFAVGDFNTATDTFTGENIYRHPTGGKFVLQAAAGRSSTGTRACCSRAPTRSVDAFYENDPHAFDQICAALGAS